MNEPGTGSTEPWNGLGWNLVKSDLFQFHLPLGHIVPAIPKKKTKKTSNQTNKKQNKTKPSLLSLEIFYT